jgi:hypothetical protein
MLSDVDEPAELQHIGHWRMAVWALRVGGVGLAIGLVGLILLAAGSTPWLLAVGVVIWVACASVTVTGVVLARRELPEPRPGYWPMRFMIIHDALHPRDSAASPP